MRNFLTALLAVAAFLLPALSIAGHGDGDLGSSGHGTELVVTGHETPDTAPHFEALAGIVELYCLGCALDKRHSSVTPVARSVPRPQTVGSRGRVEVIAQRRLELPANRSPRAPPVA